MSFIVLIGVLGLIIGSFLNVCIYRIPRHESIAYPPSHCMECNAKLKGWDLIPVFSYLFLKGKCRWCGKRISCQYMCVEVITAAIFILIYSKYYVSLEFIFYSLFMSILIVIFFIDLYYMIIPDKLVLFAMIVGLVVSGYSYLYPLDIYGDKVWWNPLLGMIVGAGVLILISLLGVIIYKSCEVIGMGDIKLLVPIGLLLGWKMVLVCLYLSIVICGIISVILILCKVKKRSERIPFAPFIVLSTLITILYGWEILSLYVK